MDDEAPRRSNERGAITGLPGYAFRHPAMWLAIVLSMGFGAWLLRAHNPAQLAFMPPCPVRAITGWHCPGCGSGRAVHSLLNGRLADAVRYNPILIVLAIFFVFYIYDKRRAQPYLAHDPRVGKGLLIILVVYAVLRNMPGDFEYYLAPRAWGE